MTKRGFIVFMVAVLCFSLFGCSMKNTRSFSSANAVADYLSNNPKYFEDYTQTNNVLVKKQDLAEFIQDLECDVVLYDGRYSLRVCYENVSVTDEIENKKVLSNLSIASIYSIIDEYLNAEEFVTMCVYDKFDSLCFVHMIPYKKNDFNSGVCSKEKILEVIKKGIYPSVTICIREKYGYTIQLSQVDRKELEFSIVGNGIDIHSRVRSHRKFPKEYLKSGQYNVKYYYTDFGELYKIDCSSVGFRAI